MPAPTPAQMAPLVMAAYGQSLGSEGVTYLNQLLGAISAGWQQWQLTIQFGAVTVSGAGAGAWAGVGVGGSMTGGGFTLTMPSFLSSSPQQVQFTKSLGDTLNTKFMPWPATFKFANLPYAGASTSTGSDPGAVTAPNIPTPLAGCGKGGPMTGIADLWKTFLVPPAFDLNNPQAKSDSFVNAIGSAIEQSFQTVWLATTLASGNMLTGPSASGGTVPGLPSQPGGKLV